MPINILSYPFSRAQKKYLLLNMINQRIRQFKTQLLLVHSHRTRGWSMMRWSTLHLRIYPSGSIHNVDNTTHVHEVAQLYRNLRIAFASIFHLRACGLFAMFLKIQRAFIVLPHIIPVRHNNNIDLVIVGQKNPVFQSTFASQQHR